MRFDKRGLLAITVTLVTIATASPSCAEQIYKLKASIFSPAGNALVRGVEAWADKLKKESNGRLVIEVFPSSQMGPPQRQFDLARTGVADIAQVLNGLTPGRFPLTELAHIPGVMNTSEYGGALALSEVAPELLAKEYPGVKIINVLTSTMVLVSPVKYKTASSLKGLRVRAAGSVQSDVFRALGAIPTLVQPGDLNDALAKGMIDAASIGFTGTKSYRLDDAAKFIAEGDLGTVTFVTVMNQASYDKLPSDLRRLIDKNSGVAAAKLVAKIFADDERQSRETLRQRGVTISALQDDDGSLAKASGRVLAEAITKAEAKGIDAHKVLERIRSAVAKYKNE